MMEKKFIKLFCLICLSVALSACDSGVKQQLNECTKTNGELSKVQTELSGQVASLNNQISVLRTQNEELSRTPARRLSEIKELIDNRNEEDAKGAIESLRKAFPPSAEVLSAEALLASFQEKSRQEKKAAERQERLGFKALREQQAFDAPGIKLVFSQVAIADRWNFDSYGDSYFYRDATRNNRFVVARVSITAGSSDNNPRLPGLGVYAVSGKTLTLLNSLDYKFVRWDEYASYLGNEADFKNDFAHTATIPFTLGAEIPKDDLQKPLVLVAGRAPCKSRSYERFDNPPVSYKGFCEALKSELSLEEAVSDKYIVLKTWNFNKL